MSEEALRLGGLSRVADVLRAERVDLDGSGERELLLRTYHKHARFGFRSPTRKMIVEMGETTGQAESVELYHLDEDPAEARNRYEEVAAFAVADVERLLEWATDNVQNRASRGIPLTSAERALLVKLGYVDDE